MTEHLAAVTIGVVCGFLAGGATLALGALLREQWIRVRAWRRYRALVATPPPAQDGQK